MSFNPNLPPQPDEPELQGRELMIALMGAGAFRLEQGPNAHVPEELGTEPEQAIDESPSVNYVETIEVAEGVMCDTYTFEGDSSRDLAIVRVEPGSKTPLQRVLQGTETIEGYLKGKGILTVRGTDGIVKRYFFASDMDRDLSVVVRVGEEMQWKADKDAGLVFYEICEPPYEDGRFENLAE